MIKDHSEWMEMNVQEVTHRMGNSEWTYIYLAQGEGKEPISIIWTMLANREATKELRICGGSTNLMGRTGKGIKELIVQNETSSSSSHAVALSNVFVRSMGLVFDKSDENYYAHECGVRVLVACYEENSLKIKSSYLRRYAVEQGLNLVKWFYFAETRNRGGYLQYFDKRLKSKGVEARLMIILGLNRENEYFLFEGVKVITPRTARKLYFPSNHPHHPRQYGPRGWREDDSDTEGATEDATETHETSEG